MQSHFPKCPVVTGMVGVALLTTACASGPTVITNNAPNFNLANYSTFGFFEPLSTDQGNVRTINSSTLIEAATRELEMAGLRRVDTNPDLLVNFHIETRETLQTRPSTSASFHHSRRPYGAWSGYSWGVSTTEIVQRTEGTLAIDIVDRERSPLVWEGMASGRVTDAIRRNAAEVLDNAVSDIFAEFP